MSNGAPSAVDIALSFFDAFVRMRRRMT